MSWAPVLLPHCPRWESLRTSSHQMGFIKHERELLTAHLLKWRRKYRRVHSLWAVFVIFDGDALRRWRLTGRGRAGGAGGCGADFRSGGPHCQASLKFPFAHFMLMSSIYEFRWQHKAEIRLMDSSQDRWGRTSHREPRFSSWALNPSLCVWLLNLVGSGITGMSSAHPYLFATSVINADSFQYISFSVGISLG